MAFDSPCDCCEEIVQSALANDVKRAIPRILPIAGSQEENMPEVKQFLRHTLPLGWIHIPKCGSSMANIMIHTPGVCRGLPPGVVINQTRYPGMNGYGWGMLAAFKEEFPLDEVCPGSFSKWGQHEGVGDRYKGQYKGHGIIMLRDPEARLVSSYNNGNHDWPPSMRYRRPESLDEYADFVQGCTVKMLARTGSYETCGEKPSPSESEVGTAIRMLNGIPFVGITEEWDLSVCLFRKLFGGQCYGSDFFNTRPEIIQEFNATIADLRGWTDSHDRRLYEAGKKLFHARLREHGLSRETCEQCFAQARVNYAPW